MRRSHLSHSPMFTTLISAPELQQLLNARTDVRVLDCSADLMDPSAGR